MEQRKHAISIRLGESDLRNIKGMAKRLGVRYSDVIRYAVKSTLSRISPLCDEGIRGRNLVPVLVEFGDELIRHFELDAFRLEAIINERADEQTRVHRDDVALLAMGGLRDQYLLMRFKYGTGAAIESQSQPHSLRGYLYDKYVYRTDQAEGDQNDEVAEGESIPAAGFHVPAA